ncbi:alpha-1,3-mannosyl-glycoprotein 4-beta-N-acetylglucosaminyltransferase A isoform X2 [Perca fluviatilis]|uniref:alpha-1,3-mannosyl-glycoprotein 4-beta-N-acetylglucosaminyltransferase A isoform X2 n=1 Tax=Perca fluviatilis TaxID=8168 RepID=UPI0019634E73|nr:alpha-1,3-mannosyl-glycoprotein 4-beta-N-acetylglucosaminyltransferase A isoform X2 [Perca fluviatilis]
MHFSLLSVHTASSGGVWALGCLWGAALLSTHTHLHPCTHYEADRGEISPKAPGSTVRPDLQTLYQRLLLAEELGGQVSRDLSSLLEELRNTSRAANISHPISSTATTSDSIPTEKIRQKTDHSGQQTFVQPNIYLYMPHLRQHPDSLLPNVVLGQGRRGVSLVLGIPTVKREKQNYLVSTLRSLLYGLTTLQQQDLLIIVFVAETDSDYVGSIAESIRKNFSREVQSGLLEVISPSQYYYPDFSGLRETFGDSKDRVKWRTKQNLDYSFLMLYAQDKGTYYVQLEDDVVAKAGYFNAMKTFANQQQQWLYLEFSQLGFIGKMFQSRDLPMIAEFFLMFHRDKPIDWLLDHILWVKVCNPEKDAYALLRFHQRGDLAVCVCVSPAAFECRSCHSAEQAHFAPPPTSWDLMLYCQVTQRRQASKQPGSAAASSRHTHTRAGQRRSRRMEERKRSAVWLYFQKDCNKQKAQLRHRYKPSLFQHVGLHSSLSGKLQQLKSLFQAHSNPAAELSSSLKHYQQHSLERAYRGQDFFWALTPSHGDYILFNFTQPIHISRYLFRSGNIETSGDKFTNTTVEVLPSNASARDRLATGSSSSYKAPDEHFITIGAFENGVAEGEIEEALQPISALRLVVHSDADVWALLSEIHIAV